MEIILIRHGQPETASNPKVNAAGFANWVRAYNKSKVALSSPPPKELTEQLCSSFIVSSDLSRAIHSARLCTGRDPDLVLKGVREMDIPRLKLPFSLRVNTWLIICRISWLLGGNSGVEKYGEARRRLFDSIQQLEQLAKQEGRLAVFGHGLANRYLAKELKQRGWKIQSSSRSYWGKIELQA